MNHPISQFVEEHERRVEIYMMTCRTTQKSYVGQAVTHILNHKKYRRYGMQKRFNCHVSEAFSAKKNQCHYLNAAIRKYGADDFELKLLDVCTLEDSDKIEESNIIQYETMFPGGYNLKYGTITTRLSLEGRKRVSKGVQVYFSQQKFDRFKGVEVDISKIEDYIRPLRREKEIYGYYVYINRKNADFGGVHIPLEDSYEAATQFILELANKKDEI